MRSRTLWPREQLKPVNSKEAVINRLDSAEKPCRWGVIPISSLSLTLAENIVDSLFVNRSSIRPRSTSQQASGRFYNERKSARRQPIPISENRGSFSGIRLKT